MPVNYVERFAIFVLLVALGLMNFIGDAGAVTGTCPALPAPDGPTVTIDSAESLKTAVETATSGTTILIADGTYDLSGIHLKIEVPELTLRSASGQRDGVVLDGHYSGSEIITVAVSDVTIADMTIQRARTHPIHVVSTAGGHTLNTRIYNVHIIDPGEQAIKINAYEGKDKFTDDGVVACSTLELTDAGRAKVLEFNGRCYTGGVDGHESRGWVVRDNIIRGFWCESYLSEHGIHFWTGSRDTVVERNTLIDNTRGIGFGLYENNTGRTYTDDPCPAANGYIGHYDGIIRNNFIFASRAELFASEYGADGGIALAQACGGQVLHNTVAFTQPPFAAIEYRYSNTYADLMNNLVTHTLMDRGGHAVLTNNLSNQPLSLFEDGQRGDLHLTNSATDAIDKAVAVAPGTCNDDIDGHTRPRGTAADIGADEYRDVAANTAPLAQDQQITVQEDSTDNPVTLTGTDAEGDALNYTVATGPTNGTLGGTAPDLYYSPNAGHKGSDGFTFKVDDDLAESEDAIITITVQAAGSDSDSDGGGGCFMKTSRR